MVTAERMKNGISWFHKDRIYLLNKTNYYNLQVFDMCSHTWSTEKLPQIVSSSEYKNLLKVLV